MQLLVSSLQIVLTLHLVLVKAEHQCRVLFRNALQVVFYVLLLARHLAQVLEQHHIFLCDLTRRRGLWFVFAPARFLAFDRSFWHLLLGLIFAAFTRILSVGRGDGWRILAVSN